MSLAVAQESGSGRVRHAAPVLLAVAAGSASVLAGDWIAGAGVCTLAAIWYFLHDADLPPVLPLAISFQWLQVFVGVYYCGFTGRPLLPLAANGYRAMVLVGMGCVLALVAGLWCGKRLPFWKAIPWQRRPLVAFTNGQLFAAYAAALLVTGALEQAASRVPRLAQVILVFTFFRGALLFLVFRRLVRPRFRAAPFAFILAVEVVSKSTGYLAGFLDVFVMAGLAMLETFDGRRVRHWLALGGLSAALGVCALAWTGIKAEYRMSYEFESVARSQRTRLGRVAELSSDWFRQAPEKIGLHFDALAERLWVIYFPALAIQRVPAVVPHENGAILWNALKHLVTPRLLFPDKDRLQSDSVKVRKYSGVWVAGEESGTSIAFGYAAEAYVDFGAPLLFVPVFLFAFLMGIVHQAIPRVIRHRELALGLLAILFWANLYQFERSWVMTLGASVTSLVFLGGTTWAVDRFLLHRRLALSPLPALGPGPGARVSGS